MGDVSYAVDIPSKERLHDLFHVSCFQKKVGIEIVAHTKISLLDE